MSLGVQNTMKNYAGSGLQAAAFEMLLNAILNNQGHVIQQLLNSDPHLVHMKGWHDINPLHRACLTGDYNIVLMLIQANADVNSLTAHKETPLHYASRRGIPSIVHLLIQCGAKIDARDLSGKSVLHFAAETGSAQVIKYFEETHGLNVRDLDAKLQSPLHIACTCGHLDLFTFLIKHDRSDLNQADIDGNLPIHISSKNGFGHMTWCMLRLLGVSVLKKTNNTGLTPLDFVAQGDKYGHKELAPILKSYAKQSEFEPVTGPVKLWYGLLLYPFTLYLAIVLLSECMESYQFLVYLAVLVMFILHVNGFSHRINHISRWPNPFYTGVFAAGIIHTTICYFYLIFPVINSSRIMMIVSFIVCPALFFTFWTLVRKDPGAVTSSVEELDKPLTLVDLCSMRNPKYNYCPICDIITRNVSKHCKLCDKCYLYMDHHCLFLLKCIAANNHAHFLWLLLIAVFNMCSYMIAFGLYIWTLYPHTHLSVTAVQLIHHHAWPLSLFVLNLVSAVWVGNIIATQFFLVTRGCTAYFTDVKTKSYKLTAFQAVANFIAFLFNRPLPYRNPYSIIQNL
ncbi:uncharacterized protein LOC131946892 [Physella acuta]|uniref:uncharacterized protein LOC131946892 n=1 Tax=Physella acuta TaxID=109671 RepID=UPI0027DB2616|nr:uncharacterized protein LOC131946892 [Physella acuta]